MLDGSTSQMNLENAAAIRATARPKQPIDRVARCERRSRSRDLAVYREPFMSTITSFLRLAAGNIGLKRADKRGYPLAASANRMLFPGML
jgi:hypothetical protein